MPSCQWAKGGCRIVFIPFLFTISSDMEGKNERVDRCFLALEPYVGSFYVYCDAHALSQNRCSGRSRSRVCELLGRARPNPPSCLLPYVDVSFLAPAAAGWPFCETGTPPLQSVVRGVRSWGNCGTRRRPRVHSGSQVKRS